MRQVPIQEMSKHVRGSVLGMLVGDMIGEGAFRRVYDLRGRPDLVLKVERFEGEFANIMEWRLWDELQWDPRAKLWLAPCLEIDRLGLCLLQVRCRDLTEAEWSALAAVPAWLADTKRDNWGWFEDPDGPHRPVMRDYSHNKAVGRGVHRARLVEPTR